MNVLVNAVSSIPQAMPLAIVWGGLKFMMGVGILQGHWRSLLIGRYSGLNGLGPSSSRFRPNLKCCRSISSDSRHAKRSILSPLTLHRVSSGSWPNLTKEFCCFGTELPKSSVANVSELSIQCIARSTTDAPSNRPAGALPLPERKAEKGAR